MSITEVFGGKTSTLAAVCTLISHRLHFSKFSSDLKECAVGVFTIYYSFMHMCERHAIDCRMHPWPDSERTTVDVQKRIIGMYV